MNVNQNLLILPDQSIREAMSKISENTHKVIFVVNDVSVLLGSLSDGDIRRALLDGFSMDSPVIKVMNSKPIVLETSDIKETVSRDLDTKIVPVIDDSGRLVTLLSSHTDRPVATHPNTVLLMAGGFGKRLRPLTNDCPKPMLELNGKPILLHVIDQFKRHGFKNFLISTFYLPHKIKDYFGDGSKHDVCISYLQEEQPMGTAGCVSLVPSDSVFPILVANSDLITEINYSELLLFNSVNGSDASMVVKNNVFSIPFGVVDLAGDSRNIAKISEKPDVNVLVNAGVYCLGQSAVDFVKHKDNEYLDMPDLFNQLLDMNKKITAYRYSGYWEDLGTIDALNRVAKEWKKR